LLTVKFNRDLSTNLDIRLLNTLYERAHEKGIMNCVISLLKQKSQGIQDKLKRRSKNMIILFLLFTVLTCSLVVSGCLREEGPVSPVPDILTIKDLSLQLLNNTTYITGRAENVGNKSIIGLNVEAIGYNENNTTILKRGYADTFSGIKPIIAPGDESPFMIRLSDVANTSTNKSEKLSITNVTLNTTKGVRVDNVSQNQPFNITQTTGTRSPTSPYYNKSIASYKIKPHYTESAEKPYSLIVINNKTIDGNQKRIVAGEIYNNGTKEINSSVVAAALYKRDGTVLGVFLNYVNVQIQPAKTLAFQIEIRKNDFPTNTTEIALIELYAYKIK